jgi:hypothetical protein
MTCSHLLLLIGAMESPRRPVLLQLRPRGRALGTPAPAARRLLRVFLRVFEGDGAAPPWRREMAIDGAEARC